MNKLNPIIQTQPSPNPTSQTGNFKTLPALVQVTIKHAGVQLTNDQEIRTFQENIERSLGS